MSDERARRWRLVLGPYADATGGDGHAGDAGAGGALGDPFGDALGDGDRRIDAALDTVYRPRRTSGHRRGGLADSAPAVVRWLGEVRQLFDADTVRVLQRDAIDRLGVRRLLLEPEVLDAMEPDVHLAALVMELADRFGDDARERARAVVERVVADLVARFTQRTRQAIHGALHRAVRTRRPRPADVDWSATVRANLRHYQPQFGTVVPEQLLGFERHRRGLAREMILAVDQSASMATSIVYAAVFGAALASVPSLDTHLAVFDTNVVDLTEYARDPLDVLAGVHLGGGTDIGRALQWCRSCIRRPSHAVVVVITDLYEGVNADRVVEQAAEIVADGSTVIALASLGDEGTPSYDRRLAARLAAAGVWVMAATPDVFADLVAAALRGRDLVAWSDGETGATALARQAVEPPSMT